MAINISNNLSGIFSNFESAASKVRSSSVSSDSAALTDGMIEMTISEKMAQLNIKHIQSQDEMLGYIIDIKK